MRCSGRFCFSWVMASWISLVLCATVRMVLASDDTRNLGGEAQSLAVRNQTGPSEEKESLPAEVEPAVYPERRGDDKGLSIIGNIDASYSLSKESGKSELSGGELNGIIAPRYRFTDTFSATMSYDGQYYKRRDYYSDAVGPKQRTEFQRHTVTPSLRYNFGENYQYSLSPSFFYTRTYNKDVEGGGWSDGLYNYEDIGGGLDLRVGQLGFGGGKTGNLRMGLQYYKREYPNYTSLLDLATGLGVEEDERDYQGWLGRIRYSSENVTGLSWEGGYTLLYKDLEDKKVVNSDGELTSDEQDDYLHHIDIGGWYVPEMLDGLRMGVNLSGGLNRSNQNYYDAQGSLNPNDHVFLRDYYDYNLYVIHPNVSYRLETIPLTVSCFYSFQRTDYTDRKAENSDGTYKNDEQYEDQQTIGAGLRYALLDFWSLYVRWQYIDVTSNNDNVSVYDYSHTVNTYYAGTSLGF